MKAYDNYVKGLKKEDRPSIRKKLDTLQKQVNDSRANPLQKEQEKKNIRKNDYHRWGKYFPKIDRLSHIFLNDKKRPGQMPGLSV